LVDKSHRMKKKHDVVIGLGSNIGNRLEYLELAISEVEKLLNSKAICSEIYQSKAWGFQSEDKFLNCCISLKTDLSPEEVLKGTKTIEKNLGRVKKSKKNIYQSRVIDIDILYFDDVVLSHENLTIPHPLIQDRMFVVRPLADIIPAFIDPVKKESIMELLVHCNDENEVILYTY